MNLSLVLAIIEKVAASSQGQAAIEQLIEEAVQWAANSIQQKAVAVAPAPAA